LRIIENATQYFHRLKALDPDRRDQLVAFLMQRCFLVVIAVANVDMAHRIFTVLNARGLDLTPADILKADLLDRVPAIEEKDYSDSWESIEVQLGRDKFVELFQHIRMIYQREKPRERLEVGFKKFVSDFGNHASFMNDVLQPFGETLAKALSPAVFAKYYGNDAAKRLRYLAKLDNNDWVPVALLFFVRSPSVLEEAEAFMRSLETLGYYLFVTRADINERIKRYASVLTELVKGTWIGGSIALTGDGKKAFREGLDGPIYEVTRVRLPLLLRLDAELSSGGASYDETVSVEHVLPQTPDPNSRWLIDFPIAIEREEWTHKLANLVLLTLRKNIRASNWDFVKKKTQYFSEKGGVSPFVVTTQVLAQDFWTPSVLQARQRSLLSKLYSTWDLVPEIPPDVPQVLV
jgi:Protein of unknown function (DUF1524)